MRAFPAWTENGRGSASGRKPGGPAEHSPRRLGIEIRRLREDAGLSQAQVADMAGISQSLLSLVENAKVDATVSTVTAIAAALGATAMIGLYPETGPPIRDHLQARMIESLLRILHPRWRRFLEVPLQRPVRGVIDLVLQEADERIVIAAEAQSEMRRLEQQLRWGHAKADALLGSDLVAQLSPEDRPTRVSSLLLLRSTRVTRELAMTFHETLTAAFPAPYQDALEALRGRTSQWPGAALLWVRVDPGETLVLERPPRGVDLGR